MQPLTKLIDFLEQPVGNGLSNNPADVRRTKRNLKHLGYLKRSDENGYITRLLDTGIKNFQRDNGLRIDGLLFPGGETENAILKILTGNSEKTSESAQPTEGQHIGFGGNVSGTVDAEPKAISEKNGFASKSLPPPTSEPVDKEELYKILEYDPNKGGGDLHSLFKFGFEPRNIAREAEREAQKIFPDLTGYEDESDAFRHALGSYLMTKRYGEVDAKLILDRHERSPGAGLSPPDTEMGLLQDLYNNRVGRDAALNPENKDRDPVGIIMEFYKAGKLQTRPFRLKARKRK